jgi:vitamin B12 transport system substrate-binding protein
MTMSQHHWPAPIFALCGGENSFNDSRVAYPQISLEQVLIKHPQVIFSTNSPDNMHHYWQRWNQQLLAVQNKHLYSLNADWLNRPTLRSLSAVKQVCADFNQLRHSSNT